jgi:hypothetical protein
MQLTRRLADAMSNAEIVAKNLALASQETIDVRLLLAQQQGHAELLADQLAGCCVERDVLGKEKLALGQEIAVLRDRSHAGAGRMKKATSPTR